jgi:hypothetical protein
MIETGVIDPFGNFIRFCQRETTSSQAARNLAVQVPS